MAENFAASSAKSVERLGVPRMQDLPQGAPEAFAAAVLEIGD
jgi:hypothetical protein